MVTLAKGGAWLVNGREVVQDGPEAEKQLAAMTGQEPSREEAKKNTIAYGILESHNTSGNMQQLKIRFDKLTSHDITFVGIIQTARASGLTRFPIPYVLTNCHNSLCAVGGTINEDDHMFGLTCARKYGGVSLRMIPQRAPSSPNASAVSLPGVRRSSQCSQRMPSTLR